MLTVCKECGLQMSDKAISCPHCGCPNGSGSNIKRKRTNKRRRLPNGFGQISEIKNMNLRKPFRVLVTIGKDGHGKPICKPLKPESYFETYNDAYMALAEYNRNPYDLDDTITMETLYDRWTDSYFKTLKSESSVRTIQSAWAYCSSLNKIPVKDVRARHLKGVIDNGFKILDGEKAFPSAGVKARMKSLFNLMMDYAVEYELTDRNYARTFVIDESINEERESLYRGHTPFSDDEMQKIKENVHVPWVDVVLVQCYMGWRPQELCTLKISDIDINSWTITGGMKTNAGIDRVVPIHTSIRPIIEKHMEQAKSLSSEYLFNCTDTHTHRSSLLLTYDKYKKRFEKIVKALNLNPEHRPHDPRKHFVTMAKKYKVDEYAIKYIVGHEINDITEKVYTERNVAWLSEEIEKIV